MIKTDIKLPINYGVSDIKSALAERLPISIADMGEPRILRRALNLSDKKNIHYDMTVALSLDKDRERGLLKMRKKVFDVEQLRFDTPQSCLSTRPVVVGAGPSGLFCALVLAEAGARPLLIERGLPVDERRKKVELFNTLGILDTECNVQFGEGGAGTYSDGKLKSGSQDKYKIKVLSEFVLQGAPEHIMFSVGAHLGTDRLSDIVKGIRNKIISLGGEVCFSSTLVGIKVKDGRLTGGKIRHFDGERDSYTDFETDNLVLATGHSATDVFEMLLRSGAKMQPRGFGIGVRIEHPQEHINRLVYGENPPCGLGAASYHLVAHLPNGRSVYSFCMCPGGSVVAAASEAGGIVTNGMSEYLRDGENANAAFLVSVTPDDFGSDNPLAGIELQRRIEKGAYAISDSYVAPTQAMGDFLSGKKAHPMRSVAATYPIGTVPCGLDEYMPGFVAESLRAAIPEFDDWMPGFYYPDAPMTGPETRTTSPVRVLRDEDFEAPGISGLYPTGEGAGYAGGIISSARDGVMVAEAILRKAKLCKQK